MPSETLVEALGEADLPSDADVSAYFATMSRPHQPRYRNRVAKDADTLLPILARFASPEAKREVLAMLAGEPDLFWSQSNNEVGLPSVSEAADFTGMQAGDVEEFDVAKTLGKRWIAMLPTDFERDDGYVDGIGWLDGEAVLFDTEAEADTALADRKAKLLAPEVPR